MLRLLFHFMLCLAAAFSAPADETVPLTEQQLADTVRMDVLTVPGPGEFFAAIAKVERPNWSQVERGRVRVGATARPAIALNLGLRVADGYLAVEAQDSQRVKNIGRDIMELARKLNASESVLARGKSISDFAENNDWNALREELEATKNEVKMVLREQKDDDLIVLITLGAWIRGIQAGSEIVQVQYSPDAAALLRQPAVADYLLASTQTLPERMLDDPAVRAACSALEQTRETAGTEPGVELGLDSVETIHNATTDAIAAITAEPEPEPAQ